MRAFGGAIIFAFPLLMTMEMWQLGFSMDRWRLFLFLILNFGVLVGLSYFAGFEKALGFWDILMDAFAAYGVGVIASAAVLAIFGILASDMPLDQNIGKVAVQSVPASIGAIVARKQLGSSGERQDQDERERRAGYAGQLFLMLAGALFLAFNVAPTEEMILIAFKMTPWHGLALVLASILLLHAFVYAVGFAGQEETGEAGFWKTFISYSIAGYGIAIIVSLYVLWTFGRTEGVDLAQIATMAAVLGFPAALGAAIARLVV
jgi:putative integral membrane protein (TIGR02587 family)